MKSNNISFNILVNALITAPTLALMALASALIGSSFLPFALFNGITRVLPGPIVTFGIDLMIDTMRLLGIDVANSAKLAEQAMAIGAFFLLGTLVGTSLFQLFRARRIKPSPQSGLISGAVFGLLAVLIAFAYGQSSLPLLLDLTLTFLFMFVWSVVVYRTYRRRQPAQPSEGEQMPSVERIERRQFIITLGATSATITVLGAGLAAFLSGEDEPERAETLSAPSGEALPLIDAEDGLVPAPGTRPELTSLDEHYKVFIQLQPSVIDGASWAMPITGLVENPLTLTLEDLPGKYETRDQFVTLTCISGRVGTTLIGTTLWTGVSLQEILADVRPLPEARFLDITSEDGFHETVSLDLIDTDERIMLCYAWDGKPLPEDHGFPLRIWIPDRYGMKQPKWITSIEVVEDYRLGYWVERRWDEVARVNTTSVIDTVAVNQLIEAAGQPLVPIGGIAYSGARGVSKVEVRVDEGPWQPAQLRMPLSETTWVIWRYDWPYEAGSHTFEVRCFEADGTPQIERVQDARPSGSTGIHMQSVRNLRDL